MKKANNQIIVYWAYDPFAGKKVQKAAITALKILSKNIRVKVQPLYLWNRKTALSEIGKDVKEAQTWIQKKLNALLGSRSSLKIESIKVIEDMSVSSQNSVKRFLQTIKVKKNSLILVSTHALQGFSRLLLGSFTETLLSQTSIPILVVNSSIKKTSQFNSFFFATDFSKESKRAFHKAIELAKSFNIQITIYHKPELNWPQNLELNGQEFSIYEEVFKNEVSLKEKEALNWISLARKKGVIATFQLDRRKSTETARAIIKQAKNESGMIALTPKSGVIKSALFGSVTRKVVRDSDLPVWILPSNKSVKKKPVSRTQLGGEIQIF